MKASLRSRNAYQARVPHALLLAAVFAFCFPSILTFPGGLSVGSVLAMITAMFSMNGIFKRAKPLVDLAGLAAVLIIAFCILLLSVWSVISVIDVPQPLKAARVIVSQVVGACLFASFYAIYTSARGRAVLILIVGLMAISSLIVLISSISGIAKGLIYQGTDRAFGFFRHPNQYGMVLATFSPIALSLSLSSTRLTRALHSIGFTLIALGLVASGSKTNLLLLGCTSTLIFILAPIVHDPRRAIPRVGRNIVIGALMVALSIWALVQINPRALRILTEFLIQDGDVRSLETRAILWEYSYVQFLHSPLFGQGAGQEIDVYFRSEGVPHAHNVLLDYLRMLGAPGFTMISVSLLASSALLILTAIQAYKDKRTPAAKRLLTIGSSIGALSYIVSNMTSDSFGATTSPFFWIVLCFTVFARVEAIGLCKNGDPLTFAAAR